MSFRKKKFPDTIQAFIFCLYFLVVSKTGLYFAFMYPFAAHAVLITHNYQHLFEAGQGYIVTN